MAPPGSNVTDLPEALMQRADQVCDRFEAAWKNGPRPRLEDWLGAAAGPERSVLLSELISLDVDYRRLLGEAPQPEEYHQRFPDLDGDWLRQLLGPDAEAGERANGAGGTGPAPPSGSRRLGKFELLEQVGVGAFGSVWRARDTALDRIVALKRPHADLVSSPTALERFQREARAAAQLRHPGIVTVHEVTTLDGLPAIVSDFVDGVPLREFVRERRLTFDETATLVAEVADALDYAHGMGAVHRDVKPANIMLETGVRGQESRVRGQESRVGSQGPGVGADGAASSLPPDSWPLTPDSWPLTPRLLDFGLALREQAESALTLDGQVVGTPAYMSPEQASGKAHQVDGRSDVYSLGVVLYELLTGEVPFQGSGVMLLQQVLTEEPRPPRRLSDQVPRDLETICLKCLQKEPHRRYARAADLADDLRRYLCGEPVRARPIGVCESGLRWARRRPAVAALLGVGAVAALALVALAVAVPYGARLQVAVEETEQARQAEAEQRQRAESHLYCNRILLASREWSDNNVGQAERLLEQCPADLRGWEWHYLRRLCRRDLLTFEHPRRGAGVLAVQAVAYRPDGRQLATGGAGGVVRLWDATTGREQCLLGQQSGPAVVAVAYCPDGRHLAAAGHDGLVRVWDVTTGALVLTLRGHRGSIYAVAYSPDGRRLASARGYPPWDTLPEDASQYQREVKLWDAATGQELATLQGHTQDVVGVAFSPDGTRLASAGGTAAGRRGPAPAGKVRVWDATTGTALLTLEGHTGPVTGVAFSPDGRRLASSSRDQTVKVWDAVTGEPLLSVRGHRDWVKSVTYSPDGRRLASAGFDGAVKVWDARDGRELFTLRGHTRPVTGVAFRPDGLRLASSGSDGMVKVWDTTAEQEALTLRGRDGPLVGPAFLPDGGRLVTAGNPKDSTDGPGTELKVWNLATGRAVLVVPDLAAPVNGLAVSPDGRRLALASDDRTVQVREAADGRLVHTLRGHSSAVLCVAFSPDGRHLLSAGYTRKSVLGPNGVRQTGELKLWDAATGQEIYTRSGEEAGLVRGVTFRADGGCFASANPNGTVTLWDTLTGQALRTCAGHEGVVAGVAFSPDGRRLASAGRDHTVKVWDVETGAEVLALRGHMRFVTGVTFSPHGRRLATASADKTVKLWDAQTGQEVLTLRGHDGFVTGVAFSPDGQRLAAVGSDGTARVWESGGER